MGGAMWTEEEKQVLRKLYAKEPMEKVQQHLPGRTYMAITTMARRLKIKRPQHFLRSPYRNKPLARCIKCGAELTPYNWGMYAQQRKNLWHVCNSCLREYWKRYEEKHKNDPKRIKKNREWNKRQKSLYITKTVNGVARRVRAPGKRPWVPACELCGKERKQLEYHHWDDGDFSKGLWLCSGCHRFAERVDKGFVDKYLGLKNKIMSVTP